MFCIININRIDMLPPSPSIENSIFFSIFFLELSLKQNYNLEINQF